MEIDSRLHLYKIAASNLKNQKTNEITNCKENLFQLQEVCVKNGYTENNNNFCPIIFFASAIKYILQINSVKVNENKAVHTLVPHNIIIDSDLVIFACSKMNNLDITKLYIRYYDYFKSLNLIEFNAKAYYSQNYFQIDKKYVLHNKLTIDKKAALFYVEYGFWYDIHLKHINHLQYICSYPKLIDTDTNEILKVYYMFKENENILKFDPYVYVASNYENLKYLIDNEKIPNENNETRIYNHYIRHGYTKKIAVNSFDYFEYLANNYHEIKYILTKNKTVYWTLEGITPRNVAIHFLKYNKRLQNGIFNAAQFVQDQVANENINSDKKMSIENASKYFVENYINLKQLRFHTSKRYRLGIFISQRIKDSLRTIPMQFTRCFISLPL